MTREIGIITQTVQDLVGRQYTYQPKEKPFDLDTANAIVAYHISSVFNFAAPSSATEPVEELIIQACNRAREQCGLEKPEA